jgi:fructose-1-phosphate kinase PfkB-like protein
VAAGDSAVAGVVAGLDSVAGVAAGLVGGVTVSVFCSQAASNAAPTRIETYFFMMLGMLVIP